MNNIIDQADRPAASKLEFLTPRPETWKNYSSCPWAKSILQIDPETDDLLLTPVTCKRWGCLYCARRKIRKLAFLTHGANPNRWIRLGVDPQLWESPEAAWRATSPKLPECCKLIRKERGECEYLRVTELHESGWPHYHALLRSSYIPQRRLSEIWGTLTGAPVVWIAKIDQSFSTFRYLVKYLTKLHKIEWTDRHVSYSRGFFREEDLEKLAYPEKTIIERIDTHPWQWLSERYDCDQIAVDSSGNYHLPYDFCGKKHEYSRESLGLPPLDHEKPEPAKTQRALTGLADYDADTYADTSF